MTTGDQNAGDQSAGDQSAGDQSAGGQHASRAQLHTPFRARRGRVVGWASAIGVSTAILVAALILPWSGPDAVGWFDRVGFFALAVLLFWGLSRFALISATPSETGLAVRNVLLTRRLEWAQVVGIRFGDGDPWVSLDLSDGDTLAVMAIQRADGDRARREASRLATLIALHSPR